jgi:hypothetical protein
VANKITFIAEDKYAEEVCPKPFPASQLLPQWWKDKTPYGISPDNPDGKKLIIDNLESNATFKKCTPMLDTLTSGYIMPLWADALVDREKGVNWRVNKPLFDTHGITGVETPDGYSEFVLKFISRWHIKTPPGYSVLITAPFGYNNNPFRAITGIIDTDRSPHPLHVPMWVKNNFDGIVEIGTPMFQVIPFKRDNWKADFETYEDGKLMRLFDKDVKATIVNNYIKNHWTKKSYK